MSLIRFVNYVLVVLSLLLMPVGAVSQTFPSKGSTYTPPPARLPTYTPPVQRGKPAATLQPSNTLPVQRPAYTPQPSTNAAPSRESTYGTPARTNYTTHIYTPGSSTASSYPSRATEHPATSDGTRVYTPRAYSSSTSYTPTTTKYSAGVHSENGVTTYTPRAAGSTSYTSSAPSQPSATSSRRTVEVRPAYHLPESSLAASVSSNRPLPAADAHIVLRDVNLNRANLSGLNKHPIPSGKVIAHANGNLTVTGGDGKQFDLHPDGRLASFSARGENATFRGDGRIASVHTAAIDITRGRHGQRTIVTVRPDHSTLVSMGPHTGYLQRTIVRGGESYIQRTYVSGGLRYSRLYATYTYHGLVLNHYVPAYTYAPAFYGWAYYPWNSPVAYAWGWAGTPWYWQYGDYYFSPWATYLSGAYWLTDYYLSQTLADAYQEQVSTLKEQVENSQPADDAQDVGQLQSDGTYAQADTPISTDIKNAIAEEVQQQLAYENAAATQPDQAAQFSDLPQVLQPNHVFVVDQALSVATADQQNCGLSAGDVLRLAAAPPDDSSTADLTVASSRRADCPAGIQVTVSLQNLQEMQNNFRAQLDAGLHSLHDQQGHSGLPGAPQSAIAPPPIPAPDVPPDSENIQALLQAQQQQANLAEKQLTQLAFAAQP